MSLLMQAGSTKKRNNVHVYILEQNPKSGYIRIQFMLLAIEISRVQFYQKVNIIVMSSITSFTSISMLTLLRQIELEI